MIEAQAERTQVDEGLPRGPRQGTDEVEPSIDLAALFAILWAGKRRIFAFTFAGVLLATLASFLAPVRYTSTTSFIPPNVATGNSTAAVLAGPLASVGGAELLGLGKNPADLYAGILKSRSIAGKLVGEFHLMQIYGTKKESQAEKLLQDNTLISTDTKTPIVTVSVTAKTPQLAHDLASAYMNALRETNGRLALSQASQRRVFFEQQLAKEKDSLENAEVALKQTQENSGLIAPLGQTEAEIRTVAETQAQIALRQVQLAALRESATEQNSDVIRLKSEIENLQSQLERLRKGNEGQASLTIPTSQVPEAQLQYIRAQREVKYHETLFELLSRQYESARLDESREAPLVQVLDEASFPDVKSSPRRLYYLLAGLMLGIIAGAGSVLIPHRLARNA